MVGILARQSNEDPTLLSELAESGEVNPVIDRRYPLSEAAAAIEYQGEGHARGKIVIGM